VSEANSSNLRVAAQAVIDHAQKVDYASDYVLVRRSTFDALGEVLRSSSVETAAEPSVAVLSDAATEFARYQLHEAKGRLQLSAYDMLTCAFLKGVAFSMHGYKFVPPLPVKTTPSREP
jgi:hypothetical protein